MTTTTFDPVAYKQTTTQQWQEAAEAWHRWGPTLEEWLGEATELMLDLARHPRRARACSTSRPARAGRRSPQPAASARAAPCWRPTSRPTSSTSPQSEARAAGLGNVATRVMDGESLDVEDESVDAVISRVGLIYFPDQQRALAEMRRALREGGRVAAIVYSTPERNQFFSIPVSIIRRRAGLPAPAPGLPGPFSLGQPGVARGGVRGSRLPRAPRCAPSTLPSASRRPPTASASSGSRSARSTRCSRACRRTSDSEAWAEIEEELRQFEGPEGFVGPCELLVGAATK